MCCVCSTVPSAELRSRQRWRSPVLNSAATAWARLACVTGSRLKLTLCGSPVISPLCLWILVRRDVQGSSGIAARSLACHTLRTGQLEVSYAWIGLYYCSRACPTRHWGVTRMPQASTRTLAPSRCTASNSLTLVFGRGRVSAAGGQSPRSGAWLLAMSVSVVYSCCSRPCATLFACGPVQKGCCRILGAGSLIYICYIFFSVPSHYIYCQRSVGELGPVLACARACMAALLGTTRCHPQGESPGHIPLCE